jgi:hypothetical protein
MHFDDKSTVQMIGLQIMECKFLLFYITLNDDDDDDGTTENSCIGHCTITS